MATQQNERPVTAVLGTKLGMTQVWDEAGRLVPVTVVQVGTNVVTQVRTAEVDGYAAVQLAYGQIDPRKVSQPLKGHFEKAGVTPRRHVTAKGKGFAGVMKRHGFHGVGASHGAHKNHRKPGSIGGASTPSRVFKGVRMAGRMGVDRQTTQNLTVHAVDAEKGLLLVKGAVPGPKGGVVLVRSAAKGA
jgi:large subunit ribosomal protein L3